MAAPIKRFLECYIPIATCNIDCSYCYVNQEQRKAQGVKRLSHSAEFIASKLSRKRLGEACFISLCASGETLVSSQIIELTDLLLRDGHYVNITTNGTLSKRFKTLSLFRPELIKRLHVSFSFHYCELKKDGMLDTFFCNFNLMRSAGASVLLQMNLVDEYIDLIDEIKKCCIENAGALPQIAVTRNMETAPIEILSSHTLAAYQDHGKSFNSPMFDFSLGNFQRKNSSYCMAGRLSSCVNLENGAVLRCYFDQNPKNAFGDDEMFPIGEEIGYGCQLPYCINSMHFLALGVAPSLDVPSYAALRDRPEARWMNETMKNALSRRLYQGDWSYRVLAERAKAVLNRFERK
jgi:organic radical activating enzyme